MHKPLFNRLFLIILFTFILFQINSYSASPQYPFKADLDVRTMAYEWETMPVLSVNIINQDVRAYDSLEVRFYVNGKPDEMGMVNSTTGATIGQFAARLDLGILYREDGFQDKMDSTFKVSVAVTRLKHLPEFDDSAHNMQCWCYPLSLEKTVFRTGTRVRLDLLWNQMSPLPPFTDLLGQAPKHTPGADDWSYGAKKRTDGDPADFGGIKQGARDDVDRSIWDMAMNPYIAIFRNDSLLYGLPPDWKKYYDVNFDTIPRHHEKQDPMPYGAIAVPFDEYTPQLVRDSANLAISRFRVNQAGYRPGDANYFYYVGTSAPAYSIVNMQTGAKVASGTATTTGLTSSGQFKITGCKNSLLVSGGEKAYQLTSSVCSGTIFEGVLPELPDGRYKITSDSSESAPFVIRSDVYNMIKDALLKFYGVNRCGDSKSWFHPPCHVQDAVTGGWHDCGDHLKEGATMSYTAAVLGLAAAAFADRDQDVYNADQSKTRVTDGIPDILYEAKHGADFILQSFDKAEGKPAEMVTSVGGFGNVGCGDDHAYWGQPEYQDLMPLSRGGPPRCARKEVNADYMAKYAANLAFVAKRMRMYDTAYAGRCLKAAVALYEHSKLAEYLKNTNTSAYNGGVMVSDDMAFGCLALLYATGERKYLDELCFDTTIGRKASTISPKVFNGGWFVNNDPLFSHNMANTDWASVHAHVLWGFYRLVLDDSAFCEKLGLTNGQRLGLVEKTVHNLICNISSVSQGTQSIPLPDNGLWVPPIIKYDLPWFTMQSQMEWVWNRYQAGNITEMFYYYDIASKIQGTELPNSPSSTNWKADEVRKVVVRMMGYQLGINPWDICMISGIGSKNFNHPHHRAANPELRNTVVEYDYRHLIGALAGGAMPTTPLYTEHADDYFHSEVGIDGTTNLLMPTLGLSVPDRKIPTVLNHSRTPAPLANVKVVSMVHGIRVTSASPISTVEMYSIAGRRIMRQDCSASPVTTLLVQPGKSRRFVPGLYLVRVKLAGKKLVTRTVSVER